MTKHPPHVPEVDDVPIRAMTENDANGKGGLNSPVGKGSLDESNFSSDDIVALIRAVKFAHPEMSMRGVYNEISGTMADSDESYAFLKEVRLNDVKKVWKKALKESTESIQDKSPKNAAKPRSVSSTSKPADSIPVPADGVLRFYTVGDGSVKTLVDDYANHHAGAAIAASQQACEYERQNLEKYSHFFADVPADRSGTRPHQALINFNDNRNATKRDRKNLSKAVSKSGSKAVDDGKEIFKIQLAALPSGMEDVLTPMLLYNSDRTTKTFIHPPSPSEKDEDDGGYFTIKTMITKSGTSGALGTTGGQKAYFWGIVTKNKSGPNIISIDLKAGLAPAQSW